MQKNKQYFNDAQQFLLAMNARDEIAVCGRGFGKGAVQAGRLKTGFQGMPGSTGGFVAPSVKRCLTNILPSLLIHLERWGYHRDIHYVVGKKPWAALHWQSPIFQPANWENTISFYNGSICNIISQDRTGTSNSMSLDYIIVDEAKFINADQLRNETFLANRGNQSYFGEFFMHHGMTITSDMPITKKGSWFLEYEKEMDPELVATLWFAVRKVKHLRDELKAHPEKSLLLKQKIAEWRYLVNSLRHDCLLYCEFTSLENIDILGEDYIRRMKRELSPQTFETAILNRRSRVSKDGFYSSLDEDVNFYTAPNNSLLNFEDVGTDKIIDDCRLDGDLVERQPLMIAFDANSNFNCMVVGQVKDSTLRVVKSFFVKFQKKLEDLVDDFCKYYKYHPTKHVIFYFDSTFKGSVTGKRENELYYIIETALRSHGWMITKKFIGHPMAHLEKNILINNMLKGKRKKRILINRDNNEELIVSIESAGVVNDKKDKSGEKLVETEEDLLEYRTDFSDAFDTLCIGAELFPTSASIISSPIYYG